MKFSALGATLIAATFAVSSPAFAAHTHHKGHHGATSGMHKKGMMHQKGDKGSPSTEDLNARSLQQAQTPVPATAPMAAPNANPTMPSPAPMPMEGQGKMPSSSMPAAAPQPPANQ